MLGCEVYQGVSGMQARRVIRGAVEMWSVALGPGSTVKDMAWVYQEQVASQVAVQAQAVPSSEGDMYKMAAAAGGIFQELHLRAWGSVRWRR